MWNEKLVNVLPMIYVTVYLNQFLSDYNVPVVFLCDYNAPVVFLILHENNSFLCIGNERQKSYSKSYTKSY